MKGYPLTAKQIHGPLGCSWEVARESLPERPARRQLMQKVVCETLHHEPFYERGFESKRGNGCMWGFCKRCGVGLAHSYGAFPAFTLETND